MDRRRAIGAILDAVMDLDELDALSMPHLPFLGSRWREGPKLAIVGRADLYWPPKTSARQCRFQSLRDAVSTNDVEAVLAETDNLNHEFVTSAVVSGWNGEQDGAYHSPWWRFCRDILVRASEERGEWGWAAEDPSSALAVANLYPVCLQGKGNPPQRVRNALRAYRPYLGQWLDAIQPNAVLYAVGDGWVTDVIRMVPGARIGLQEHQACDRPEHDAAHEVREWYIVSRGQARGVIVPHPQRKTRKSLEEAACMGATMAKDALEDF